MWHKRKEGWSAEETGDSLGRADLGVGRLRISVLDKLTLRCHEATKRVAFVLELRVKEWAES